jgi:hypothetical protein
MAATQSNASEQLLRETAYLIWEHAGRPFGQAELHWEMAKELTERTQAPTAPSASAESRPRKDSAAAKIGGSRKRASGRDSGGSSVYQ